jgi:thioredoxin-related protein
MKTFITYYLLLLSSFNLMEMHKLLLQRRNNKPVIIYGSPDCHYCTDLKDSLTKQMAFVLILIEIQRL